MNTLHRFANLARVLSALLKGLHDTMPAVPQRNGDKMSQQAYYGISAVHYSDDHTHIERFRVHDVTIGKNGIIAGPIKRGRVLTRNEVVDEIERGRKFMTLLKKDGNWVRGKEVGKYTLTFLRSYPSRTKLKPEDDLEDLA